MFPVYSFIFKWLKKNKNDSTMIVKLRKHNVWATSILSFHVTLSEFLWLWFKTLRMGKNICKWNNWERINLQIITIISCISIFLKKTTQSKNRRKILIRRYSKEVAQMVKNLLAIQKTQVRSLGISWRRAWLPTPVFLRILENFMDREAWKCTVHGVAKELEKT